MPDYADTYADSVIRDTRAGDFGEGRAEMGFVTLLTPARPKIRFPPRASTVVPSTGVNRWDEKAGLRTGCGVRSQVIDVLKAQIKRRPAMKKVSTVAVKQGRNISQQKLTIGLDLGDRNSWYCVVDEAGQ